MSTAPRASSAATASAPGARRRSGPRPGCRRARPRRRGPCRRRCPGRARRARRAGLDRAGPARRTGRWRRRRSSGDAPGSRPATPCRRAVSRCRGVDGDAAAVPRAGLAAQGDRADGVARGERAAASAACCSGEPARRTASAASTVAVHGPGATPRPSSRAIDLGLEQAEPEAVVLLGHEHGERALLGEALPQRQRVAVAVRVLDDAADGVEVEAVGQELADGGGERLLVVGEGEEHAAAPTAGRPSTRSATMLRWTWDEPPQMVTDRDHMAWALQRREVDVGPRARSSDGLRRRARRRRPPRGPGRSPTTAAWSSTTRSRGPGPARPG